MDRRVLVALDGSRAAESAVWHAAAVADALGCGLRLLQVLEADPEAHPAAAIGDVDWRLRRAEAQAYLDDVAARVTRPGLDVSTTLASGAAADEIVRQATAAEVDLIVLAAYGHGEAHTYDFGGTGHKVLSRAPTSVMVVRRDSRRWGAPAVAYRRILVALDGSPAAEWALGLATAVARRYEAALLLLHLVTPVAPPREPLPRSAEEDALLQRLHELRHERGERYLAAMEARLAHTNLAVRSVVTHAPEVSGGIREVAENQGADLIALAAHGASGAPFAYGAVAQRLLALSDLPVLVFQDLRAANTPDSGDDASARTADSDEP